jgi:hypothetical protein
MSKIYKRKKMLGHKGAVSAETYRVVKYDAKTNMLSLKEGRRVHELTFFTVL